MKTNINCDDCDRPVFPSDLSRRVGNGALLEWSLEAVQQQELPRFRPAGSDAPEFRPEMLLTLLTYCYSTGLYSSADIEAAAHTDRTIRYICAWRSPDRRALRRFRRQHREFLQETLGYVLRQAFSSNPASAGAKPGGAHDGSALDQDSLIALSVQDKLDLASIMDGAEDEL